MYVDTARFSGGKQIIIGLGAAALVIAIVLGGIYGLWITKQLFRVSKGVQQIATRSYVDIQAKGAFRDVFGNLNTLDAEIKASDVERKKNEIMREEWIANITHDLKTPLAPIKGYAELLSDPEYSLSIEDTRKYGATILKNAAYAEALVNDLKLTYQLKNGMIPLNRKPENITRFLKELIIDVLNNPEYASRDISFTGQDAVISFEFDQTLMKRALGNILHNALVHNPEGTVVCVSAFFEESGIQIQISDNGRGMEPDELENLFTRYYRGTNSDENVQGTGLGLAISKQIITLHNGHLTARSEAGVGTVLTIDFPSQT
jgi:signal transduction histidine kinase